MNRIRFKVNGNHDGGSAILEFVALLILLMLPLISSFTLMTVKSQDGIRLEDATREISNIFRHSSDVESSISIARRLMTLQGVEGELIVTCVDGNCPHRGSLLRVEIRRAGLVSSALVPGGQWQ